MNSISNAYLFRAVLTGLTVVVAMPAIGAVGSTIGDVDVSPGGEAKYSINISVPPGINRLTPQLALAYGHRQKETMSGIGWGIAGLSEINRCAKTRAQDTWPKSVVLISSDRYCRDGVQLRLTSGTYGVSGSTYRTEVDTASRYTAYGTAGNGPAWFKLEDKNGLIYEYGNSSDSRIESLASGWTTTAITWALSKIKDRQGNEVVFTYYEDSAPNGGHRISSITYRGNPGQGVAAGYSINFVYETQPSGDVDDQYAAGGKRKDTKRLDRIDVWYTPAVPDTLVRRYELTYEGSLSSTGRSRLSSVQECAGSPLECFAPTTFTYQNGTNGFGSEVLSGTTIPSFTKAMPLDINGDGRTDLVYPSSSGSGTWMYRLANSSGGYGAAVNSGIANTNHSEAIAIDYNADGLDDILVPYSGGTWWVIQGSAGGLQSPINTTVPDQSTAGYAIAADMNGDGLEDLVYTSGSSIKARYRVWGGTFSSTASTVYTPGGYSSFDGPVFPEQHSRSRARSYDANGDGIRDVMVHYRELLYPYYTGQYRYHTRVVLAGGGDYLVNQQQSKSYTLDVNGDGYHDAVYKRYDNKLVYEFSTGKSYSVGYLGPSLTNLDFNKAVVLDWNSDGFDDLLLPNTSTGKWNYIRSTGTGFASPAATTLTTSSPSMVYAVDANGDGMDDLAYTRSDGKFVHRPHLGTMPDYLKTATDGDGNSVNFNYAPITQSSYTKYSNAVFPQQDYAGPLYVVTSAVPTTGVGSGTYTLTYTYAGAQMNLEGRGLSGFDKKTTHDSRNGVTVTEYFKRDFPFRGRLYKQELKQSSGTKIQELTHTWGTKTGGTGNQSYSFPYIQQTIEKNYEVGGAYNGAHINDITTTYVVDAYGTPTSITKVTTEKSSANGAQSGASFTEQLLNTSITNNTTYWCLGKPGQTQRVNSHNQTYGAQITRTVSRSWNTSYCRMTQEITEPGSATYKVTRAIGYDGFGNINSETITGVGMSARTTTTSWGATGQFPVSVTNALSQTTTHGWDAAKGVQTSETDPNGLSRSWLYDKFGRKTRETRVDGTYTDITLTSCTSANSYCGTSYNRVRTKVHTSDKTTSGTEIRYTDEFLDKEGRAVQVERQLMGGAVSRVRTIYDSLGRVSQKSAPSFSTSPAYYATTSYDVLNRPTQISTPIDVGNPSLQYITVSYKGLTTTTTDPEGKTSTKVTDVLDRVHRSVDHAGYYQQFDYDAFGSVRRVKDSLGNDLLRATYAYGRDAFRLTSNDMDMGSWSYSPNALGEVVAYTDAKGQSFSATFDKLSRPLTRTEPGNSTNWTWGTSAAAKNIGRLASIAATGHSESYTYDSKGRISQRTTVADATYHTNYSYVSSSGQLDTLTYPTSTSGYRLKLKYAYQNGVVSKVSDYNVPATVFWEADAVDARGNVIQETLGNGLETVRGFDDVTGRLDFIQSGPGGGTARQNMEFSWNKVGSLKQRKDLNRSLTEDFYYDNLHRLDYSRLNSVQNLDISYDSMGNITYKSDVGAGTWSYHATKKHAVTGAGGDTYTYDANGNQITRNSDDVSWTSYNYPSRIENGSKYHDYFYDAERQRWKQVYFNGSSTETTIFVGDILEKRTSGSVTEYRHYVRVGEKAMALYTRPTSGSITTQYFLFDHLGSVAEITNASGAVDVSESFAAFGQRRDPTDWVGTPSAGDQTAIADATQRGYTFHTNMESSPLIHMNGRVADSLTGRFLSPDPYVFSPGNTQSFNRYSYVNNNPLTFTDPSGHCLDAGIGSYICRGIITTALNFLFGKKKRSVPKGCFLNGGTGCYGAASSSKIFDVVSDILTPPGLGPLEVEDHLILNIRDGRFDSNRPPMGISGLRGRLVRVTKSPLPLPGNVEPERYGQQLQEHLLERLFDFRKHFEELSDREQIRDFGGAGGSTLVRHQIDMMIRAFRMNDSMDNAQWLLDTVVGVVHPYKGKWKWLNPIKWINSIGKKYDVSGWDVDCLGNKCGFIDPNNELHLFCDMSLPGLGGC